MKGLSSKFQAIFARCKNKGKWQPRSIIKKPTKDYKNFKKKSNSIILYPHYKKIVHLDLELLQNNKSKIIANTTTIFYNNKKLKLT